MKESASGAIFKAIRVRHEKESVFRCFTRTTNISNDSDLAFTHWKILFSQMGSYKPCTSGCPLIIVPSQSQLVRIPNQRPYPSVPAMSRIHRCVHTPPYYWVSLPIAPLESVIFSLRSSFWVNRHLCSNTNWIYGYECTWIRLLLVVDGFLYMLLLSSLVLPRLPSSKISLTLPILKH